MENKINIAEILKDCPQGMGLDCTMWDGVTFEEIQPGNYPIKVKIKGDEDITTDFTEFGEWNYLKNSKCVIFPKGKTTWEGFVPPCKFKDGDIVTSSSGEYVFMLKKAISYGRNNICYGRCYFGVGLKTEFFFDKENKCYFARLATEEEKQKLFDFIRTKGYKWDAETKTLKKLIKPKFKVGDNIRIKGQHAMFVVTELREDRYMLDDKDLPLLLKNQDHWELVPNKFDITTLKPFESKVLVREAKTDVWQPTFYGFFHQRNKRFYTTSSTWLMCIPYNEDTKHLTGTTNDCDEFYKTWE